MLGMYNRTPLTNNYNLINAVDTLGKCSNKVLAADYNGIKCVPRDIHGTTSIIYFRNNLAETYEFEDSGKMIQDVLIYGSNIIAAVELASNFNPLNESFEGYKLVLYTQTLASKVYLSSHNYPLRHTYVTGLVVTETMSLVVARTEFKST
jgi:hypothetical protein